METEKQEVVKTWLAEMAAVSNASLEKKTKRKMWSACTTPGSSLVIMNIK